MPHPTFAVTEAAPWSMTEEGQLSVDVFETEDAVIIQSAIAGVEAKDLEIFVNTDMVTIRGMRRRDVRSAGATMHFEECFWGAFSRSVVLPASIAPSQTNAELKDGILTVTLTKVDQGGRTIPIHTL